MFDPDKLAENILKKQYSYAQTHKKVSPRSKRKYDLLYWKRDFYRWRQGCYHRVSHEEVSLPIACYLRQKNEKLKKAGPSPIRITERVIKDILLCLQSRIKIFSKYELNAWLEGKKTRKCTISVANGLLRLDPACKKAAKLVKHNLDYFTLTTLPYSYDPEAKCPRWLEFLHQVMDGRKDYILLLQQWVGYLFRPDLREQKFLLCVGEGANGKGVFFEVIQELLGTNNCSQVSIAHFKNRFALYSTIGKVVNVTNESSGIIEHEAETTLKAYVAGDRFTVDRKFKDPISIKPTAKIMVATNDLPRFTDKTEGIWRRILLSPFDKKFTGRSCDPNLADKLKKELPGILNWALEGLRELTKAKGFTMPESQAQLIEEYRRESDPTRAFLSEQCKYRPSRSTSCHDAYLEYKWHCQTNGYHAVSQTTFGKMVHRVYPKVKRKQQGPKGDRTWHYVGLITEGRLRREKEQREWDPLNE